jgi:hypothetical protein
MEGIEEKDEDGCACESGGCDCECEGCGDDDTGGYIYMKMQMAKAELLHEKIKARLEAKYGKKFDRIADLIVEIEAKRMKANAESSKLEEELDEAFESLYSE